MLWPPSYFLRRSCANLSRSAPVMRLPFLSSATLSSVGSEIRDPGPLSLESDLHLPTVTRATRMDVPVATVRSVPVADHVTGTAPPAEARRQLSELSGWLVLVGGGLVLTAVAAVLGARVGSSAAPFTGDYRFKVEVGSLLAPAV